MNDRDYIMRMVEQFARFLGRILFHKKAEQRHEAQQLIEEALQNLLGLDAPLIDSLGIENLLDQLSPGGELDADKCLALGVLLAEGADIVESEGNEERADVRRLKALALLLAAHESGRPTALEGHFGRIADLAARLWGRGLSRDTLARLFAFFEARGDYARAEDALFERIDPDDPDLGVLDEGLAFYRRLLELDDAHLAHGNLPRSEIEEGLAQLESLRDARP